jgi:hypothetical protein
VCLLKAACFSRFWLIDWHQGQQLVPVPVLCRSASLRVQLLYRYYFVLIFFLIEIQLRIDRIGIMLMNFRGDRPPF